MYGFRYIVQRPSLLGLQLVFFSGNFFHALSFTTFAAMILARSNNNSITLGSVESIGAIGALVGAAVMSAWGGPRRRVQGVTFGWAAAGLFGSVIIGLGRSLPVWGLGLFLGAFFSPIINGSNQAIWQAKVAPDVQGRVFSIRRLIAWVTTPAAQLAAIPLADRLLTPAMSEGGALTGLFGWLVGVGPGAGMSLLFVLTGLILVVVGLVAYLAPAVRFAEDRLPDHEAVVAEEQASEVEAEGPAPSAAQA
jgi:hypothetical protein